jgi:AcrR family transcriptional regulator
MPRAFTQPEREIIHKRLLAQGNKFFSAYGLKKTNIDEIARAAGISKGAFYSFYESKEALFMDVIEEVEIRLRLELLAAIDQPGPTPRARLLAVLKKAFSLFETMPLLKSLTSSDYELLSGRVSMQKFQQHLTSDRDFIDTMIVRCQEAGIPIRAKSEDMVKLMYPLVLAVIHQAEFGPTGFSGGIEMLLELIAAFCLGEVEIQAQISGRIAPVAE